MIPLPRQNRANRERKCAQTQGEDGPDADYFVVLLLIAVLTVECAAYALLSAVSGVL